MQINVFTDEKTPAADSNSGFQALRVVIAYDDLSAGKRAMGVLADLGRGVGEPIEFEPLPWSFDMLADVDWREMAANDAVKADILIIASSANAAPLPSTVGSWTETAIRSKRGTGAAVIALFGSEESPDGEDSPRVRLIQQAAIEAGLDFFAPAARGGFEAELAKIHRRAEMVTPLLAGILNAKAASSVGREGQL